MVWRVAVFGCSQMPCYHPLRAWQKGTAKPVFSTPSGGGYVSIGLPCGQCIGCRLMYSREWALRCVHETQVHEASCMLTLTYDDEHLPADMSLDHRHVQLFLKRLRERVREKLPKLELSYYMCGEYGEEYSRPHYHVLLFGFDAPDRKYWKTSKAGFKCFTSVWFDSVWGLGAVYVGDVSFESAAYVARYVLKKVGTEGRREILDVYTGEIITRAMEYGSMSTRPAIGKRWFLKFASDVFPRDYVNSGKAKLPVPAYYYKLLERESPLLHAELKAVRLDKQRKRELELYLQLPVREKQFDLSFEQHVGDAQRLDVHEVVQKAKVKLLKRS